MNSPIDFDCFHQKDRLLLQKNGVLMDVMLVKMVVWLQTFLGKFFLYGVYCWYLYVFRQMHPLSLSQRCKGWCYAYIMLFFLCVCLHFSVSSIREGLDFVKEAINRTGYNEKIKIAIDVAATDFCKGEEFITPNGLTRMVACTIYTVSFFPLNKQWRYYLRATFCTCVEQFNIYYYELLSWTDKLLYVIQLYRYENSYIWDHSPYYLLVLAVCSTWVTTKDVSLAWLAC